jgi:hypothetical protein
MAAYPTNAKDSAESPAKNSFAITPHASNEVGTYIPRAIYVGGGGTLAMRLAGDTADVSWIGVPAGCVIPVRPLYIRATGTTCTGIIGLY